METIIIDMLTGVVPPVWISQKYVPFAALLFISFAEQYSSYSLNTMEMTALNLRAL